MPGAGSEGLRQHRVRVFAASPGPARALHHEGDERVPAVDVDCLGSDISRRDDCPVLVVQVPVFSVQLIEVLLDPGKCQPGDRDHPVELRHHLGSGQDRQRGEVGLGEIRQIAACQSFPPERRTIGGPHQQLPKTPFAFCGETPCVPSQPAHPLQVRILQFGTLAPDQLLVMSPRRRASCPRLHPSDRSLGTALRYHSWPKWPFMSTRARRLGIFRNTVRAALRADQVPRLSEARASDLPMRWKTSFGCCWRSGRPCRRR